MKIIEEAKKRRAEIVQELEIIDKLLAIYKDNDASEPVSGGMSIREACRAGLISVRTANNVVHHEALPDRNTTNVNLNDLKPLLADSEALFLKIPNFGRKSLNELKALMPRVV